MFHSPIDRPGRVAPAAWVLTRDCEASEETLTSLLSRVPDISKSESETTLKEFIGSLKAASADFAKKNRALADHLRRSGSVDEANRTSDHRLQIIHGDTRESVRRLNSQLQELGYEVCSSIQSDADPPSSPPPNDNLLLGMGSEHRPADILGAVGPNPTLDNLSLHTENRDDPYPRVTVRPPTLTFSHPGSVPLPDPSAPPNTVNLPGAPATCLASRLNTPNLVDSRVFNLNTPSSPSPYVTKPTTPPRFPQIDRVHETLSQPKVVPPEAKSSVTNFDFLSRSLFRTEPPIENALSHLYRPGARTIDDDSLRPRLHQLNAPYSAPSPHLVTLQVLNPVPNDQAPSPTTFPRLLRELMINSSPVRTLGL